MRTEIPESRGPNRADRIDGRDSIATFEQCPAQLQAENARATDHDDMVHDPTSRRRYRREESGVMRPAATSAVNAARLRAQSCSRWCRMA
ncbi:hypothetical protein FMUBM48_43660 [Nocardia cyriacigeorgica]|nr:hypothetical protein FMUBM48_43660 [Nocardia cyriacigeorgica]